MNSPVSLHINKATEDEIAEHLSYCDLDFIPPLSERIDISNYAKKIANYAIRFEAWSDSNLVGLLAIYCNTKERSAAFVTSISILNKWTGQKVATHLISECEHYAKKNGFCRIELEVNKENKPAIKLYQKKGFLTKKINRHHVIMALEL